MRAFFLILFLTLFASNSLAQTYIYVDVSCTSNNGDGTAGGPNNSTPGSCAASPGGTGPYNTITSAVDDDIDAVTATSSYIIEVSGGVDNIGTSRAIIDLWVLSSTYDLTIQGYGSYTLQSDVLNAGILDIRNSYVTVKGFTVDNDRTSNSGEARAIEVWRFDDILIENMTLTESGGGCSLSTSERCSAIYIADDSRTGFVIAANNEIDGFRNSIYVRNQGSSANQNLAFYNNTMVDPLEHCIELDMTNVSGTHNVYIKNAICDNPGTQDYQNPAGGAESVTFVTNKSSDGTTFTSSTISFVDKPGGDYRLASNLTGTDLSTDADGIYSFSTDIAGTTRSGWSAGAWEYVATGGAADYILFEEY